MLNLYLVFHNLFERVSMSNSTLPFESDDVSNPFFDTCVPILASLLVVCWISLVSYGCWILLKERCRRTRSFIPIP